MEITGTIKTIKETATFGASGFKKRELVLMLLKYWFTFKNFPLNSSFCFFSLWHL